MMLNGISRDMLTGVIGGYCDSREADYRRYCVLGELISASYGMRLAFQEGDDDRLRENKKQKALKGDGGVSEGVSRMFRDMLEEYMPGGYFRWNEYARRMSDDFYRMAYAQFRDLVPKVLAGKLRDFNIDRSEGSIEVNPEVMNKVIMDSLVYMHENPEVMREGLVRAYRRKEGEESRGVGMTEAFFVPRVDRSSLAEREEGDSGSVREGDADEEVMANLKDRGEVKWKWRGIDEYGVLRFTLPDLYGSREFTVKLPSEIQTIKPGEYTFRIKDVKDGRGVIVDFVEQHDQVMKNEMMGIEEHGLGEDQLKKFINNGVVNKYITYLRSMPGEKLVEDFLGAFSIGGDQIGSVSDLEELGDYGGGGEKSKATRSKEKAREKYEESIGLNRGKVQAMVQRWFESPDIARHFLKVTEDDGSRIARAVASKFPEVVEKGVPSLDSIFGTRPVVEMVLGYMMSSHVPLGGAKSAPWIHFAWDAFKKMAIKEPSVRESMEKLVRVKRKDVPGSDIPVSDGEISGILDGVKNVNVSFQRLRERLAEVIPTMTDVPELQKLFERRRIFKEYSDRVLADIVYEYADSEGLSMDQPADMEKIQRFMKSKISDLVGVMEGRRPLQSLYRMPKKKEDKDTEEGSKVASRSLIRHVMQRMFSVVA